MYDVKRQKLLVAGLTTLALARALTLPCPARPRRHRSVRERTSRRGVVGRKLPLLTNLVRGV